MGTRKKKINVERVGNSGHPITTNPTPVRHVMFQDKIPYTTFSNGTVVQSTVNKDGVNEQILRKSNLNPAYKLEVKHDGVSTPDTLGLYKANHPNDLWAYDKIKPGTKEYKETVEKFNSYGIPLATYGEAYDNLKEVERQVNELQAGGSVAQMGIQPKEEFTEDEKQALSNGTFYEETTYPGGYHITRLSSGTKGENQRYPFIYSKMVAPDGSVLYQQDQYRNYPLINKSPKVIDINDVSYNLGNGEVWFNKYKSIIDGKNLNSPRTKTNKENDLLEYQQGGSIASRLWNKWTGKDTYTDGYGATRHHVPVRESAHRTALKAADSPLVQAIPVVGDVADGYVAADYAAKGDYKPAIAAIGAGLILPNAMEVGARMVPSSTYRNIADKVDDAIEIAGVEDNLGRKYIQKNGEWVPENTGEIQVLGVEKPSKWNRASDKRFNAVEDNSDRWIPETQYDDDLNVIAGSLDDSMSSEPWWGWDPVEYQQGGEIPSNDQQQLFVAIITDMAKTLGVEPSQEFAEAVMTAFENQDDSQGLLTLFTKTKDKFMNETGLFREGGKMIAFVNKFKCGGKAKKACKPKKKQEGGSVPNEETGAGYITTPVNDAKARRQWRERTGGTRAEARTTQKNLAEYLKSLGGITGRGARNSAAAMMGDPQRFAIPSTNPVLKTQPAQINENPQLSGIVPVNQDGGRVFGSEQYPHASRKEAIDAATDQLGFTRAQARMAYRNQKNALRNQGYSGNEMRQAARYNLIDQAYPRAKGPELPVLDENIEIDDAPIEINDSFVPLENEPINVKKIDTFGGSFNSAFGAARRSGLDEFTWNGKRYNTKLKQSTPEEPSLVEKTIESGSLNSPTVTGKYPDYYYNNLYNAGVKWGENFRARRDARRAEREAK